MPRQARPLLLLFLTLIPAVVMADVSLLLHEAIGVSGEETSAGHAAIYLSGICADGPVRLRRCQPGENGVVLAAYPEFGTDKNYEWLAIPLLSYLYGLDASEQLPLYSNGEIRTLLRERYRRNHLRAIVADRPDGTLPPGRWKEVIGVIYSREIYAFTLKTSPAEDLAIIEHFNSQPNQSRFSTLYHNCADFARESVNLYFPQAARRDVLNDFTITTPKAIAKSLTGYATRRPERLFNISKYSQVAGPIRRSLDNRKFSEMAITSKKYLIPQILLKQSLLVIFATSYFTTGRFNPHREYQKYATREIAELNLAESLLEQPPPEKQPGSHPFVSHFVPPKTTDERADPAEIASKKSAVRLRLFGDRPTWDKYRAAFAPLLQKALAEKLFADQREVTKFFRELELQSEPVFDQHGELMLKVRAYGEDQLLGLTRQNILSPQSNPQLAYKLMLAKINTQLKAKDKDRESLDIFEADWDLLMRLSRLPEAHCSACPERPRFLETPERTTFKQKFKKFFLLITH